MNNETPSHKCSENDHVANCLLDFVLSFISSVIFLHLFHIFHRIIIRSLRFDSIVQNLNVLNISKKYFKFQKYFFNFVNIDLNVKIIFHELKRENKILIGRKLFREIPL